VLERAGLRRLIDAMACPVEEPRSAGAKALLGPPGLLRLRVAAYRMLYEVHDGRLLVLVLTPGHRPDAHHQR
jgi:mRNA interferase RelE/StbE